MNGILNETQVIVNKIADYCKPDKIILFGSFARGEEKSDSDIDLLIIKDSDKKRPFRIKEVFEAVRGVERKYPLDPIVYTQQEIEKRLLLGDFFIKKVMEEGKIMYGPK